MEQEQPSTSNEVSAGTSSTTADIHTTSGGNAKKKGKEKGKEKGKKKGKEKGKRNKKYY